MNSTSRSGRARAFSRVLVVALLPLAAACEMFRSDAENSAIQNEKQHKRAAAGMREATAQTSRGSAVAGEQLAGLVSGTTHLFVYETSPTGKKGRYVIFDYFAPDGTFGFATSEGLKYEGKWRVDGPKLCVVNPYYSDTERCYTIATTPEGRVQYYIEEPGGRYHGLLTMVTDGIRPGRVTSE